MSWGDFVHVIEQNRMTPSELKLEQFRNYPPEGRQIVTSRIEMLRQLPVAFLALQLRELIVYDWKFPAERRELDRQLAYLGSLRSERVRQLMLHFAELQLSPELENTNWVAQPRQFSEQLTAHLWATHQIDRFRDAALEWGKIMDAATGPEPVPVERLAMVVIGHGVAETKYPLFRKLRPWGVHFKQIKSSGGYEILLKTLAARARTHPEPFGHWCIDGGAMDAIIPEGVTYLCYPPLDAMRIAILALMRKAVESGTGPEALRTQLAELRPKDLGLEDTGKAGILNRFRISVLAEGSGTQLFSTTFVQWSAREVLRRAQPLTLVARFTPRQRERSMRELLAGAQTTKPELDPQGSLIDADMGAYYTWINEQRLAGAEQSAFLVWFEEHGEALAVSPGLPRGTESSSAMDLEQLLAQML